MTEIIDLAIAELGYIGLEIQVITEQLDDYYSGHSLPLDERSARGLLIRLGHLKNSYKYLERIIINDLSALSIIDILFKHEN